MPFTVIIATAGRPERLTTCLAHVRKAVEVAGGRHRVIVVDNAPAGSAEDCVRKTAAEGCGDLIYLRSEPYNKALALNMGIRASETEWLAFTDDDTLPDEAWIRNAEDYIRQRHVRVVGGRIVAGKPEQELPFWLRPGRSGLVPEIGVFVQYDPMPASGLLGSEGAAPFGANVFVKREVFERFGGYDENLWELCRASWPLGSEDSEFGHRLRTAGEPIGYCREALVVHPVNYDRCRLALHFDRAYNDGWRQPLIFYESGRPRVQPYLVELAVRRLGAAVLGFCRGDAPGGLHHLVELTRHLGAMTGRWSKAYRTCAAWRRSGWRYPVVEARVS